MKFSKYEKLCKKKGVTSYQVSKDTGIAQSNISAWKSGKCSPNAEKLLKLAKYFDTTVEDLMTE